VIENKPEVSSCAIANTDAMPSEWATQYVSVLALGVASEVQGTERNNALLWLLETHAPELIEEGKSRIERRGRSVKVIRTEIEHVGGNRAQDEP